MPMKPRPAQIVINQDMNVTRGHENIVEEDSTSVAVSEKQPVEESEGLPEINKALKTEGDQMSQVEVRSQHFRKLTEKVPSSFMVTSPNHVVYEA